MEHESLIKRMDISDSDITFEKMYEKSFIPKEYIEDIKKANLLIIPNEGRYNKDDILFPETTRDFFDFIRESNNDIVTDIAISDADFQSLELHSAVIEVATIIIEHPIYDIAVGLIASFLYDYLKKHHRKANETNAKVTIISEESKTKTSKTITYEGPVSGIEESLRKVSMEIFGDVHENDD